MDGSCYNTSIMPRMAAINIARNIPRARMTIMILPKWLFVGLYVLISFSSDEVIFGFFLLFATCLTSIDFIRNNYIRKGMKRKDFFNL